MFPFTPEVPESTKRAVAEMAAKSLAPVIAPVVEAIRIEVERAAAPYLATLTVRHPLGDRAR